MLVSNNIITNQTLVPELAHLTKKDQREMCRQLYRLCTHQQLYCTILDFEMRQLNIDCYWEQGVTGLLLAPSIEWRYNF